MCFNSLIIQLVKQRLSSETTPSLQLDVANKAHNKRVSPVILGCIYLLEFFVFRSAWGPNLVFQIQRSRSNNSLARSLSASPLLTPLQLDVANKHTTNGLAPSSQVVFLNSEITVQNVCHTNKRTIPTASVYSRIKYECQQYSTPTSRNCSTKRPSCLGTLQKKAILAPTKWHS